MSILDHFPLKVPPRKGQIAAMKFVEEMIGQGVQDIVIEAPTGCHAPGQLIVAADGTLKRVEEIVVGDTLLGPDSKPRKVLHVHRGFGRMMRIEPHKYGNPFVVNEDHVLSLQRTNDGWHKSYQCTNVSVRQYMLFSSTYKRIHKLWRTSVDFSTRHLAGFKVIPAGEGEFFGFTLSDDGLYLLDDFTVTHNSGKSAVGAAVCHWANSWPAVVPEKGRVVKGGGYYLVTQKALQDQITHDVRDNFKNKDFASLKSSEAYECDTHGNCQIGLQSKKERMCEGKKEGRCPYLLTKMAFERSILSVTNYPYFLTERMYVGQFPTRHMLVCDECHTLERQLLRFGELVISQEKLKEWEIRGLTVPEYDDLGQYLEWLEKKYLLIIKDRAGTLQMFLEGDANACKDQKLTQKLTALQNQIQKTTLAIEGAKARPDDWVYWAEETEKDGHIVYLKPLVAAPYMDLVRSGGLHRVYMSAYPGEKHIFCRSLGLDPAEVAWIKLKSPFAPENRPIVMGCVGSMSKRNRDQTLPVMLKTIDKVLTAHHNEKGVIHCNSYALGKDIYEHFSRTTHGMRILFPQCADERDAAMDQHKMSSLPSVFVSPSMTEGFDFKNDLARWQIIAKMPYPYLGDRQVSALKERDPDWYALQTASTVIQACGRIVRDEQDHGVTYILDSDFNMLWARHSHFFPPWFKAAMNWPGRR